MNRLPSILLLVNLGCSLPGSEASPPTAAPIPNSPCGDGVCEGPENPNNCPADCAESASSTPSAPSAPSADESAPELTPPGGDLITYVPSEGIGNIAVRVSLPETPRYADGAGVVVEVATFFTATKDYYTYPDNYTSTENPIDYSIIRWDPNFQEAESQYIGRPYFDLNDNGMRDGDDYTLGFRVPSMYDKRVYSTALTQALANNGALSEDDWPTDLATPEEAADWWPFRTSVHRYPDLAVKTPDLKVNSCRRLTDN